MSLKKQEKLGLKIWEFKIILGLIMILKKQENSGSKIKRFKVRLELKISRKKREIYGSKLIGKGINSVVKDKI